MEAWEVMKLADFGGIGDQWGMLTADGLLLGNMNPTASFPNKFLFFLESFTRLLWPRARACMLRARVRVYCIDHVLVELVGGVAVVILLWMYCSC